MPEGKRAFTVIATSDATADVQPSAVGAWNKGAWKSLRPEVKITDGNGKVPANVTQAYARWDAPPAHAGSYDGLGSYDKTAGVWTLPEGFHGVAMLTLVADPPAGGKVKAEIHNPEWCENNDGSENNAYTGRIACEGHVTTPVTTRHWGSYQVCVCSGRVTVALAASSKTACTAQNSANTWHTAEVLDWNDSNDSGEWTLGGSLNATAAAQGAHSIKVGWNEHKDVADYAVYGSFSNDYAGMTLAAVLPAGTKARRGIGLPLGAKRYYAVFAPGRGGPAHSHERHSRGHDAAGRPNPYQDQAGDRHQYGVRGGGA